MKKNERFTVQILDETNLGYGVARVEDWVVFVPDVLKDERIDIKITKVKKSYAYARCMQILSPSGRRIEPKCPVAKTCGGCQLQHRDRQSQCQFKQAQIEKLFPDETVLPILEAKQPWNYRNKAQFPVQIEDGKVKIGFYRRHSNDIVSTDRCAIQQEPINQILAFLQQDLPVSQAVGLRHIFIRADRSGQAQVVFIGTINHGWKECIDEMVHRYPFVCSVLYNHHEGKGNVIVGDWTETLYGRPTLDMHYLDLSVSLSFQSFFQVNTDQMEELYRQILHALEWNKEMRVVEFYSGTGTIGMTVAHKVKEVIGVEIEEKAVENAEENCERNHILNAHYICSDATQFAARMKQKKEHFDVVVVDPPRKGCTVQGLEDMVSLRPEYIIYVSCNPVTLKRDLEILKEQGYDCRWIRPVDMFPQTIHVETVVLLSREK